MASKKPTEIEKLIDMVLSITPYPEIKGGKAPPFQDWVMEFPKLISMGKDTETISGEEAIKALLKIEKRYSIKNPEHPFDQLARECLVACYCAAHYDPGKDQAAINSKMLESKIKAMKKITGLTDDLIKLLEDNEEFLVLGFSGFLQNRVLYKTKDLLEFFKKFRSGFNFNGFQLGLFGGFHFACLYYDQAFTIKEKPPTVATALSFNLVFLFRLWTEKGTVSVDSLAPIPTNEDGKLAGKPCCDAAAKLANVALRENITARNAANKIKSLGKKRVIMLKRWPNLA